MLRKATFSFVYVTYLQGPQIQKKAMDALLLELKVSVSHTWVLGAEPGPLEAPRAL